MTSSPRISAVTTVAASVLALAPALGLLAFPPAASAQAVRPATVQVAVADIDRSTPEGERMMRTRIESAARSVCGDAVVHSPLDPRAETACRRDATEAALKQVGGQRPAGTTQIASAN